jgi:hypothetical protein
MKIYDILAVRSTIVTMVNNINQDAPFFISHFPLSLPFSPSLRHPCHPTIDFEVSILKKGKIMKCSMFFSGSASPV